MVAGTCLGSGYLGIFDERVHVRKDWSHPYPDFSLAFASCFPGNSVSNTSPDSQVGPFYRNQITADRARIAEMNALEDGTLAPAPNPIIAKLLFAASQDADVFRSIMVMSGRAGRPDA